jgi:lysophospholipase L1-like esterase
MNLLIRIAGGAALVALFLPGVHFPDLARYLSISLLLVLSVPLRDRLNILISRTHGIVQVGLRAVTFGVCVGLLIFFHRACLLYPLWAWSLFILCLSIIWYGGSVRRTRVQFALAAGTGFCLLDLMQQRPAFIVCWTVLVVLTSWHEERCTRFAEYLEVKFGKWCPATASGFVFVLYICHLLSRNVFRVSYALEAGLPRNMATLACCSLPLLVSISALRARSRNVWRTQTSLGLALVLFISVEGIIRSFGPLGYGKINHAVTRDEYDMLYSDDNQLGMRGEVFAVQKAADSIRILILGDSISYGAGVKSSEAFPQLLKRELLPTLTDRPVEVLNVSRAGWNSENELKALRKYIPYQPDIIVLGVCMNDVESSQERFQSKPTPLSSITDRYFSWSYTFSLLSYLSERRRESQNEAGYVHHLNSRFDPGSEGWQRFEKDITAMCDLANGSNIPLIAALFPILAEPTSELDKLHSQMSKCLFQNDLQLMDLRDAYKSHHWRDLYVSFADGHPNAFAHRLAAEAMQEKIADLLPE